MLRHVPPLDELNLKAAADVRWDFAALGEVMLRFDPGEHRIAQARSFHVWEGGGEYNVGSRAAAVLWAADVGSYGVGQITLWGGWWKT